jgi:hypothetical protein
MLNFNAYLCHKNQKVYISKEIIMEHAARPHQSVQGTSDWPETKGICCPLAGTVLYILRYVRRQ